ncbi:MAG TPA: nucleotidyltransferase [Candidatus Paceibacterota bacterium]|nr:nucleotidyltransferase [Candidatus Paceibacterota bacterium]
MSNDAYLRGLLAQQDLTPSEESALRGLRDTIEEQLRKGLNKIERVYYAGSFGKDTMIRELYDLDIVVYWANDCGFTLQDIYSSVGDALKRNWKVVKSKTVAWELPFDGGFHLDVVPGRALNNTFKYANLYRTDTATSLQTSIKVHIDTVRNSARRDAIRLMKLWRKRKSVPFKKSLALELITIDACSGLPTDNLEKQLLAVFRYMTENITTARLVDPANSNNVISDEITYSDKLAIQSAARATLTAQYWSEVF